MTGAQMQKLAREVIQALPKFKWADPRDLEQEAVTAMMAAFWNWDPERGPVEPYLFVAGRRAIWRYAWAYVGPIKRRPDRHDDVAFAVMTDETMPALNPSPETEAVCAELRGRLVKVLSPHPFGAKVLLGYGRPREVARQHGVAVREVYRCASRARRALRRELADYKEAL